MPASSAWAAAHSAARREVLAHPLLGIRVQRAQDERADVLVDVRHARTPISSKTSRSDRSAYHVRLLTVPSGSPSRSAISRTDSPWTWARRITWRCSGVSFSSALGDLPAQHRTLDRESFRVLLVARLVQRQRGAHGGSPARVDDRVPRDLVQPRPHAAARRVVGLGVPPGAREHLLHDLFGGPPVAERVQREAVQLARVGAIERAQRLAGGIRRDLGEELRVRRHQPRVIRAGPRSRFDPDSTPVEQRCDAPGTSVHRRTPSGSSRRPPARRRGTDALTRGEHRVGAAVGVEALDVEPELLGARPQVRVLEPALVGEQRVVHRPEARPAAPRPRRRRRPRTPAGARTSPGSAGSRPRSPPAAPRTRRRTGTRSRRRRSPGGRRPRTWSSGPTGGSGAELRSLRTARRRSGSRRADRPGARPRWLQRTVPSGSTMTRARCGKPPGCRTPNAPHAAPLGSKSESCSISMPSCSLNAVCEYVASQETP